MKNSFVLSLLLCLSAPAFAQLFGPVAVPVTSQQRFNKGRGLSLEAGGGLNLVTRRKPVSNRYVTTGLSLQPGYRLGVNAIFGNYSNVSLVVGGELIGDRTVMEGYSRADINLEPGRRNGDVTIQENWLRTSLGLRLYVGRFAFNPAFQISSFLGGRQVYGYKQVVTSLYEPYTDRIVTFDEPLVNQGTTDFASGIRGSYAGALIGVSYALSDRFSLLLDYEQGWHTERRLLFEQWRQRRSRLGLAVYYRLTGRK